jgi:hypothetical protein
MMLPQWMQYRLPMRFPCRSCGTGRCVRQRRGAREQYGSRTLFVVWHFGQATSLVTPPVQVQLDLTSREIAS